MGQSSPVNVAAEGTLDFSTRELNLTVQLYYTASSTASTNMLNVAIIQDNILGPQSGMSYNPTQVVGNQYNHMHMLRHLITGQWGEEITTTTAGTLVEKTYTYTIPEQFGVTGQEVDAILEDLSFIVFVAEGHQEILTGTKATITGVNMPAIAPRLAAIKEVVSADAACEPTVATYLEIANRGQNAITELQIQYNVASGENQTFTWQGSIASMADDTVHLPVLTVTPGVNQNITASIIGVNGESYTTAEKTLQVNKLLYTCGGWMMLEIKPDSYGSETTFKIFGPEGNVVLQGGPFQDNNTNVRQYDFEPATIGCYRLEVYDAYGDGINSGYGAGYIKLYDADHNLVFSHNGKFDSEVLFGLDVTTPSGLEDHISANGVQIFPNPATSSLNFNSEELISRVEMFNLQGQMVVSESGDVRSVNISNLSNGIYMVKVTTPSGTTTQKIVKQ